MPIEFTPWPDELARLYRDKAYWIDRPLSDILTQQANRHPSLTAIIDAERTWTYRELDDASDRLASYLQSVGLTAGDTALVQLPNVAEFYVVFFALLKMGVAPVNALFSHRRLELCAYAEQLEPKLLITSRRHSLFADDEFITGVTANWPWLEHVLLDGDGTEKSLQHAISTPLSSSRNFSPTPADQVAFFQLSGGSTGTPKLIPRTHNDYDYSVRASADICGLSQSTRYLCALPAAHNFPMSSPGALGVFHAGGTVVLADNPNPLNCFPLIERHQIDLVSLVPSAVSLWLEAAPSQKQALSSLKLMQVGGAHFPETMARRVPEVIGCSLQQVFGMAEGLVNYTRLNDPEHLVFNTQGRPISDDDEIKILDEDGVPVANGEVGMLATRGPYTLRGYYKAPEHNLLSFDQEGFYFTGDLVRRTSEGYLQVVGRVKDQINRGGEKIAAEEVESLLLRHPDIQQAALVAFTDPSLGEKSCAFITASDPHLKAVAVRRFLHSLGLADYKLPDRVIVLETMPLTAVGKIDKKALRARLAQPDANAA